MKIWNFWCDIETNFLLFNLPVKSTFEVINARIWPTTMSSIYIQEPSTSGKVRLVVQKLKSMFRLKTHPSIIIPITTSISLALLLSFSSHPHLERYVVQINASFENISLNHYSDNYFSFPCAATFSLLGLNLTRATFLFSRYFWKPASVI